MAKIVKIKEVTEVIKDGEANGKRWQLVKAITEDGDPVTGFNLKAEQRVALKFNDKYQNYNAVPVSGWQEIFFDDLEQIKKMIVGGDDGGNA